MEFSNHEKTILLEALGHYRDIYETDETVENLSRKLQGLDPLPPPEFRFGVGMADTDYGPYVFIDGPNDYHFTDSEWEAIKQAFAWAGIGRPIEAMEGCMELNEVYDQDIVRDRLKVLPNWTYDPSLEG